MPERNAFARRLAWVLAAAAAFSGAQARGLDPTLAPTRYLGHGADRELVTLASPVDGRLWGAWSYRSGAEYDIAVSVRDTWGNWSEPVFLGSGSGRDEIEPALVFDGAGNLYLAHTVRESGRIVVSMLAAGVTRMTAPVPVSAPGERATSPTLLLTGDYLLVGYRVGARVRLRSIPLDPAHRPFGVQDGPDGFPPTNGNTESDGDQGTTGVGL